MKRDGASRMDRAAILVKPAGDEFNFPRVSAIRTFFPVRPRG